MKITALAYSVAEVCSLASLGRTSVYEAIRTGTLRAVKRGRRTLVLAEDLRVFLETLPTIGVKSNNRAIGESR